MKTFPLLSQAIDASILETLVTAVSELGRARTRDDVTAIVRGAARNLTAADGASFVLLEGEVCHYVDEEAIAPLWKGLRFPMEQCVSGWVIKHGEAAVIPNVFKDHRIPIAVYHTTFVKSMAMVPLRQAAPIGAVGAYWSRMHHATAGEVWLLQALADSAADALDRLSELASLERRLADSAAGLALAKLDLAVFLDHSTEQLAARIPDLEERARQVMRDGGPGGASHAGLMRENLRAMRERIEAMLALQRLSSQPMAIEETDLSRIANEIAGELSQHSPLATKLACMITEDLVVRGDGTLLHTLLEELLHHAWKRTSRLAEPRVALGSASGEDGARFFYVEDNGPGLDLRGTPHPFAPFKGRPGGAPLEGQDVGLAIAERVVAKHGGRIWAENAADGGARFCFTLAARE